MVSVDYEVFEFPEVKPGPEKPLVLGPAGEVFNFVQTGESNGGKYLFSKLTVPPHVGPPPHIHHRTDEWFYAPNGGFSIFMGPNEFPDLDITPGDGADKETVTMLPMRPKELLYVPRNYVHGFVNTSGVNQEMWLVWSPDTPESSILPYFMNAGKVVTSKEELTEPDFLSRIRLVSMARDYGINQSADFWDFVKDVVEDRPAWLPSDRRATLLNLIHDEIEAQA
ncbi:cupin domain-containing protein [Kitasatospora sp. NPDC059722]|uniref:cupin domain-containing protein n=1 Tax=Kitasatospora sp. NPDC059722 TaxID=3346925 RepID=UPI00368B4400